MPANAHYAGFSGGSGSLREGDSCEKRTRTTLRQVQNAARRAPVLMGAGAVGVLIFLLWLGGAFTIPPPPRRPPPPSRAHTLPPMDPYTGQLHSEAANSARRKLEFAAAPPATPRKRVVALYQAGGRINSGVWPNWGGDPPERCTLSWAAAGVVVEKACPVQCAFVHDDSRLGEADAVIVEANNWPKCVGVGGERSAAAAAQS